MNRLISLASRGVLALVFGVLALTATAGGTTMPTASLPEWQKDFTLILSDVSTPAALHSTVEIIHSLGGRVGVITEPDVVFGWISPSQHQALLRAGVRAVSTDVVPASVLAGASERTIAASRFLSAVSSGEFFTRASPARPVSLASHIAVPDASGGTLATDFLDDGMTGYVNVAMLFIESIHDPNVPGSDADLYSWDQQSFNQVYDTTWAGLSRWSSMASGYGVTLYFSLGASYPWGSYSALQQPYEPILHSWYDYNIWLEPVMAAFGYTQGDGKTRVAAWNEWRRQASGADHASTYVVVKNDGTYPAFSNGMTSATYPGGPFVQMPYLYAYGNDAEVAHELGHIFWACDEYASSNCVCQGSCLGGWSPPRSWVLNCNCANCSSHATCIMDVPSASVVCPFTAQRIGWTPAYENCGQ